MTEARDSSTMQSVHRQDSSGSDTVVEFREVSKNYGKIKALDSVSFSVRRGDIFGYIGPNGAGKTTTIKILVGLVQDYRGEVYVNGRSLRHGVMAVHQLLGYHPQETSFQSWRTVRHVLKTLGHLSEVPREQLNARIDHVLDMVGLRNEIDRRVVHLSGGMKKKLGLAQALLHSPQLLVLDEPMQGLDPASRYHIKQIIRELAKSGTTVFVSSHILSDLEDIATRVGVIHQGRILRAASPKELREEFRIGNDIELIATCDNRIVRQIEDVEGVTGIERPENGRFIISAGADVNVDKILWKIMSCLTENRCSVSSIRVVQPSLEEAYLRLIGGE